MVSPILPINELENSNFCPSLLGQKFFVRLLGELKIPKCPFEIYWPLPEDWQKYCVTHFSIFCYIILDIFPVVGLPLTTIKEIIENFPSWSHLLFYEVFISLFPFQHWRQNTTIESDTTITSPSSIHKEEISLLVCLYNATWYRNSNNTMDHPRSKNLNFGNEFLGFWNFGNFSFKIIFRDTLWTFAHHSWQQVWNL